MKFLSIVSLSLLIAVSFVNAGEATKLGGKLEAWGISMELLCGKFQDGQCAEVYLQRSVDGMNGGLYGPIVVDTESEKTKSEKRSVLRNYHKRVTRAAFMFSRPMRIVCESDEADDAIVIDPDCDQLSVGGVIVDIVKAPIVLVYGAGLKVKEVISLAKFEGLVEFMLNEKKIGKIKKVSSISFDMILKAFAGFQEPNFE